MRTTPINYSSTGVLVPYGLRQSPNTGSAQLHDGEKGGMTVWDQNRKTIPLTVDVSVLGCGAVPIPSADDVRQ